MLRQICFLAAVMVFLFPAGCQEPDDPHVIQGYVEADYTYVGSPLTGRLETLSVQRGDKVSQGRVLFILESAIERDAVEQARQLLAQARDKLADMKKGARPSELKAIEASLAKAQSALELSALNYHRQKDLYKRKSIAKAKLDQARARYESDKAQVEELRAQLTTARLGGREDQIKAAAAEVRALMAQLKEANWNLDQKTQKAVLGGMVFDTLYTKGELVQANSPVLILLTPGNIKVRFFIPEAGLSSLRPGQEVFLSCDGCPKGLKARITYISPKAEYTPPVIYSEHSRSKLVFMIEAKPSPENALKLHPGQPMDVRLKPNPAVQ